MEPQDSQDGSRDIVRDLSALVGGHPQHQSQYHSEVRAGLRQGEPPAEGAGLPGQDGKPAIFHRRGARKVLSLTIRASYSCCALTHGRVLPGFRMLSMACWRLAARSWWVSSDDEW
jgi:hypothetical protein